jgi:pentatricopeptide repeat protein
VITYSSLISACEKAGRWETALQLFDEMQRDGCTPNTVTYNSLITACGQGECSSRLDQEQRLQQKCSAAAALGIRRLGLRLLVQGPSANSQTCSRWHKQGGRFC